MLPTPIAHDAKGGKTADQVAAMRERSGAGVSNLNEVAEHELLPTPTGWEQRGDPTTDTRNLLGLEALRIEVDLLPTPTAAAQNGNQRRGGDRGGELLLPGVAETLLPTPTTEGGKSTRAMTASTDNGRRSGGGQSSPPGLDEVSQLIDGQYPENMPDIDDLPPASREIVESLLPTPRATDGPNGAAGEHINSARRLEEGRATLPEAVQLLPTPTVGESKGARRLSEDGTRRLGIRRNESLSDLPALLPTPLATEGKTSRENPNREGSDTLATTAMSLLPTPIGSDSQQPAPGEGTGERGHMVQLRAIDDLLPTPVVAGRDDQDPEAFEARRILLAEQYGGDGAGTPLGVAVRVSWGKYAAAVARAERVLGRPAPSPTNPDGKDGKRRLAPAFVEWMMMLPVGWVVGHGLTRAKELERLGNGVVPLQAAVATCNNLARLLAVKRGTIRITA